MHYAFMLKLEFDILAFYGTIFSSRCKSVLYEYKYGTDMICPAAAIICTEDNYGGNLMLQQIHRKDAVQYGSVQEGIY